MIYKIFPEKSSTIYSFYPDLNTGIDEILELSTFLSINDTNEVSRILVKFPTEEINDIINNKVGNSQFDAYLKFTLASAAAVPIDYTIYCYPLSGSWEIGTGRLGNLPQTTNGASWNYRDHISGSSWFTTFPTNTTGSYQSGSNVGGGLWYPSLEVTKSILYSDTLDLEFKVSNILNSWYSSSIENNGFILKHSNNIEFTSASKFETKYFSSNTHTIYPPCLEIRWNDFSHITGSLNTVSSDKIVITLGNNKGEFQQDSVNRFRINVRDKYPTRNFQTSSVYLNNKLLPTSSYWSIKDLDTEEIIVDYDTTYTKISADSSGNYFDLYMNGLEPERNYQILIKTIINGSTLVLDDNYYFKVIR